MDEPPRCIICGKPLDEDPRDRNPDLVKPPNCHEECAKEFGQEQALRSELFYGTDPKGERWLDGAPDDPSQN